MNLAQTIEATRNVLRFKHMAVKTEKSYIHWIRRFARWCKDHPDGDHSDKVRGFLTYLAREKDVSASTQNQALNAIVLTPCIASVHTSSVATKATRIGVLSSRRTSRQQCGFFHVRQHGMPDFGRAVRGSASCAGSLTRYANLHGSALPIGVWRSGRNHRTQGALP